MDDRSTSPVSSEHGTSPVFGSQGNHRTATSTPPSVTSGTQQPKQESDDGLFVAEDDVMETNTDDNVSILSTGSKRPIENLDSGDRAASATPVSSKRSRIGPSPADHTFEPPVPGVKLARYHPSFTIAENLVTEACDLFLKKVEELKANGYSNQEIEIVCSELSNCRIPSKLYPRVKPISCLGATGKGKSSTINSILKQNCAYFHSGSKRGTYVTTEYLAAHPDQIEVYRVEVRYLSAEDIVGQVCKFCMDALKHFERCIYEEDSDDEIGQDDSDEEPEFPQLDENDRELLQKKAKTALECLCDVLCETHPSFTTEKEAEAFFRKHIKRNLGEVRDLILPALKAALASGPNNRTTLVFTANDDKGLQQILMRETRADTSRINNIRRQSCWPFITRVKVSYRNSILKAGVELADTPGTGDTNLHVIENTHKTLRHAETILVVTDHSRLRTNVELHDHLKTCIRLGKAENVILAVTKIDQFEQLSDHDRANLRPSELVPLIKAEEDYETLEQDRRRVFAQKQAARTTDPSLFMELDSKLESLTEDLPVAEAKIKEQHVLLRCLTLNEDVANVVAEICKSSRAPVIEVFPISNKQYQARQASPTDKSLFLSTIGTGIPKLQEKLLTIASVGKLDSLRHIGTERLPWIFRGVDGILTKSPMERKGELKKIIQASVADNLGLADELIGQVLSAYDEKVGQKIDEKAAIWSTAARKLVDRWEQLNANTFMALCGRNGKWKHKKQGDFNLSKDVHEVFRPSMYSTFMKLYGQVDDDSRNFNSLLRERLRELCIQLTKGEHSQGMLLKPFEETIDRACDKMIFEMRAKFAELLQHIKELQGALAVEPEGNDYAEHLVGKAMLGAYDAVKTTPKPPPVKAKKGKKGKKGKSPWHKARIATMRGRLEDETHENNIFKTVARLGRERLQNFLDTWAVGCREIMHRGLDGINKDFDNRFKDSSTVKTEEDPEAIEKLQEAVRGAMDIINGPLKERIAECQAYEEQGRETQS